MLSSRVTRDVCTLILTKETEALIHEAQEFLATRVRVCAADVASRVARANPGKRVPAIEGAGRESTN